MFLFMMNTMRDDTLRLWRAHSQIENQCNLKGAASQKGTALMLLISFTGRLHDRHTYKDNDFGR